MKRDIFEEPARRLCLMQCLDPDQLCPVDVRPKLRDVRMGGACVWEISEMRPQWEIFADQFVKFAELQQDA